MTGPTGSRGGPSEEGSSHREPSVAGIVLAGGASRRFGRDKLAVELGGRPLLRHAIDAVTSCSSEVLVSIRPGPPPDLGDPPPDPPVRLVPDPVVGEGPLVGLAATIEATTAELAIVIGGDMPWVPAPVLDLLLDRVRAGADAAALVEAGELRPLPLAVRVPPVRESVRACLEEGRRSLLAPLDALRVDAVPEAAWRLIDPDAAALRDVDQPPDLSTAGRG